MASLLFPARSRPYTGADAGGLAISVCHFPPGTSKWNKIEHRLFSFISKNWRGKPLVSLETIVSLIAATTTKTGLEVYARLDEGAYPDKVKVSDGELAAVQLQGDTFHPEWNYRIKIATLIRHGSYYRRRVGSDGRDVRTPTGLYEVFPCQRQARRNPSSSASIAVRT